LVVKLEGCPRKVWALVEAGLDVNARRDAGNDTPLYIAACKGHKEVMQVLLEAGADTDKPSTTDHGATPLYGAAGNGNVELVRVLVEAGADVEHALTTYEVTSLCVSAQKGHVDVVRALVEAGADIDKAATDGVTPLCFSAQCGHVEVVGALLEAGADIDKAPTTGHRATPLFEAARNGHVRLRTHRQHTGQYGRTCCPYHYRTRPLRRQAGRWASSITQVNGASARRKGWRGLTGVGGGGPLGCKGNTRRCDTPMLGTSSC
jgi:hypothetical protein